MPWWSTPVWFCRHFLPWPWKRKQTWYTYAIHIITSLVRFGLSVTPEPQRNNKTQKIEENRDLDIESPDYSKQCAPNDGGEHDGSRDSRVLDRKRVFADELITGSVLEILRMRGCYERAYSTSEGEECIGGKYVVVTCSKDNYLWAPCRVSWTNQVITN